MKAGIVISWLGAWLFVSAGSAQVFSFRGDARSLGMAGTGSLHSGAFSAIANPSALANIQSSSFAFTFENHYGIDGLETGGFSLAIPARPGIFGAAFISSGYAGLIYNQASVCYGRKLGGRISAGVGFHIMNINQPAGYTDLYAVVPSLGIRLEPLKSLTVALSVFNPVSQDFHPTGYAELPAYLTAGTAYHLGKEVMLCFETIISSTGPIGISGGIEAAIAEKIFFRFGMGKKIQPYFSFGMGYRCNRLTIDFAVFRHTVLGFSPSAGLGYTL